MLGRAGDETAVEIILSRLEARLVDEHLFRTNSAGINASIGRSRASLESARAASIFPNSVKALSELASTSGDGTTWPRIWEDQRQQLIQCAQYERNWPFAAVYVPPESCQILVLDTLYQELFGYRRRGVFVEIGAFDGESYSNTCFLADIGWRGYYIEPVREFAEECAKRHRSNNVEVIEAAVGPTNGKISLSVSGPFTSSQEHHIDAFIALKMGNHHLNRETENYRTVRALSPACLREMISEPKIDLLVIDIEGSEDEVITALNFDQWDPEVMIVELRDENPRYPQAIREESAKIKKRIEDTGRREFFRDRHNVIFVKSSLLKERGFVDHAESERCKALGDVDGWFVRSEIAAERNMLSPRILRNFAQAAATIGEEKRAEAAVDLCRKIGAVAFFARLSLSAEGAGEIEAALNAAETALELAVIPDPNLIRRVVQLGKVASA